MELDITSISIISHFDAIVICPRIIVRFQHGFTKMRRPVWVSFFRCKGRLIVHPGRTRDASEKRMQTGSNASLVNCGSLDAS